MPSMWIARAFKIRACSAVGPPSTSTRPLRPPTIALDIGCGKGKSNRLVAKLFWIMFINEFRVQLSQ